MGAKPSIQHDHEAAAVDPTAPEQLYQNGTPEFEADTVVKYFDSKNGLLFRLCNSVTNQWAFYNDSKKYEMHVSVTFSPQSTIRPLGSTAVATLPADGGLCAQVVVYPLQTVLFIEGEVRGFESTVDAVLLTTEYKEQRRQEKKEAKKIEKAEKKRQADGLVDDLGEDVEDDGNSAGGQGGRPVAATA